MEFDRFVYFSVFSTVQQAQLQEYFSPDSENSLFKGVPVDRLDEFRQIARIMAPGRPVRARFRGPRSGTMRDYTKKCHARSVAIYID